MEIYSIFHDALTKKKTVYDNHVSGTDPPNFKTWLARYQEEEVFQGAGKDGSRKKQYVRHEGNQIT